MKKKLVIIGTIFERQNVHFMILLQIVSYLFIQFIFLFIKSLFLIVVKQLIHFGSLCPVKVMVCVEQILSHRFESSTDFRKYVVLINENFEGIEGVHMANVLNKWCEINWYIFLKWASFSRLFAVRFFATGNEFELPSYVSIKVLVN
jgi:hypothetical protein